MGAGAMFDAMRPQTMAVTEADRCQKKDYGLWKRQYFIAQGR